MESLKARWKETMNSGPNNASFERSMNRSMNRSRV